MLAPIEFNDQSALSTTKVHDEVADRKLTAKPETKQRLPAQSAPKAHLCFRLACAQTSRSVVDR